MENIDKFVEVINKFQLKTFLGACFNGDLDLVKQIYGNTKMSYLDIENAAFHALDQKHLDIVKFLVFQHPEIPKKAGYFIVHTAREGQLEAFSFLHQNGADIRLNNDEPLVEASRYGHTSIIKYLVENGIDITTNNQAIRKAAKYNRLDTVKYLVENGCDIHNEAVKISAKSGYIEQLDYLLTNGGDKAVAEKHGNAKTQAWLLHTELSEENKQNVKRNKL